MHIYFSGIGGTGIGPLALIAKQAGFEVSGSDKQNSSYVEYLVKHGITDISIGQTGKELETLHAKHSVDWLVFSSSLPKENPNHPELIKAKELGIKSTKRDEFLNYLLQEKNLKMIAVAGTHGKTTTTAMTIWLMKQLGISVSYSVGAKISFGEMGEFNPKSEYFVYEADEYDRNFLSFNPALSIISGVGYDHADIYPTKQNYLDAFNDFVEQSDKCFLWDDDADKLDIVSNEKILVMNRPDYLGLADNLLGEVNRNNAKLVVQAIYSLDESRDIVELSETMNRFPGVSRRFEKISRNIYSDYAHTPEKIRGALQMAREVAGDSVVVVYEGLHNTRQHFIRKELKTMFEGILELYIVPSYLAREDESLEMLTPEILCELMEKPALRHPAKLDESLKSSISNLASQDNLVLCLTAGGGGSLDEWLRKEFNS